MTTAALELALPLGCAHCGQPAATGEKFCCSGCRSVHAILHAAGLDGYYRYLDGTQPVTRPPSAPRRYQELDEQSFQAQHCKTDEHGQLSVELVLEGVHCSACVWLVERVGRVVPGVHGSRVDLSRSVVSLSWDPSATTLGAIARGLESLGYPVHPLGESRVEATRSRERALLLRLGIAGAAAGNVMLMALSLYSGAFHGMEESYRALFRWASFAIATPAVLWCGAVFLRGGWAALRTRSPHMDLPVSVGILAGYAGGVVNTVTGRGDVYFDSLCALIFLLLVGRYLQQTHHRRSTSQSELLSALAPHTARVVHGDGERDVPAADVLVGAVVHVEGSEQVPVDGVVARGAGTVDTSLLSGESTPLETVVGDRVHAGTRCQSGELFIRTEAAGEATRLGRLMATVAATQQRRAPIVRLADAISGYFVLTILVVAALTLLVWLTWDPAHAVDHTVALLVVTCPCALGMATPLTISVALGRAARLGVLFKGGEYVEELARPARLVFDKTGTLTLGRPELVAWAGDPSWQAPLRALEATSNHPLARSIQRAYPENHLAVERLTELPDGGLSGFVSGHELLVGSAALLTRRLGCLPSWANRVVSSHAAAGRTPIVLAADGAVRAVVGFGDPLRPEASKHLEKLRQLGHRFEILSGDHQLVVDHVATQLGVARADARGGMSPELKLRRIQDLRQRGERVIMVGDGVNDAAAMAAANVGFAVHGGAETCLRAADVFATRPGLAPVTDAITGARRTLRAIRRGVVISLAYNVVSVALALSGLLSPLLAAILMPISSISVVTLALRAKTFRDVPT